MDFLVDGGRRRHEQKKNRCLYSAMTISGNCDQYDINWWNLNTSLKPRAQELRRALFLQTRISESPLCLVLLVLNALLISQSQVDQSLNRALRLLLAKDCGGGRGGGSKSAAAEAAEANQRRQRRRKQISCGSDPDTKSNSNGISGGGEPAARDRSDRCRI
jgi:hypothetical protein